MKRYQNRAKLRGLDLRPVIAEERELRQRFGADEYDRAAAMAEAINVTMCPCRACSTRARFEERSRAREYIELHFAVLPEGF